MAVFTNGETRRGQTALSLAGIFSQVIIIIKSLPEKKIVWLRKVILHACVDNILRGCHGLLGAMLLISVLFERLRPRRESFCIE